MRKRKGFTLVELVIVIAVIAILAGVFVGTFANIIKSANESAELLRAKSQIDEIKANDVLDEIDNSDWYSINDFEEDVAEKLYDYFYNKKLTEENLKEALQEAIYIYEDNLDNTNIHDDDLIVSIVNNSVNKPIFGGVTYYQVERLLINKWDDEIKNGDLKNADIKAISNNLVGKQLTAYDVAKLVNDCNDYNALKNVNINHMNNEYKFEFDFNKKVVVSHYTGEIVDGRYYYVIDSKEDVENLVKGFNKVNHNDVTHTLDLKDSEYLVLFFNKDIIYDSTFNIGRNRNYIHFDFSKNNTKLIIEGNGHNLLSNCRGLSFSGLTDGQVITIRNLNIKLFGDVVSNDNPNCGIFVNSSGAKIIIDGCSINSNNSDGIYLKTTYLEVINENNISNYSHGISSNREAYRIYVINNDDCIVFSENDTNNYINLEPTIKDYSIVGNKIVKKIT